MRNHQRGKLYVISGPSGAGKGTICKAIAGKDNIELSISMTTRNPRPGEIHGKDYFFATKEEFLDNIEKGNLLEYATVYENMYGTPKDAVISKLERGRNVILEIDIQGGLQVKKLMPEAILIFILPPSLAILRERLVGRQTDSPEVIEKRLAETLNEIKLLGEYDYYVVNDELEEAVSAVKGIIDAEARRVPDKVKPIIGRYEREKGETE
ncbi:MAG: guanylate kinase [Clostridiales bacterium]|nr:guanylate kinase [Candidatus Crickella merdequi]